MATRQYDAIVVGGGISGLVAGAQLAVSGHSLLLIEKNKVPGGCATSFTRAGYHFDTGTSSLSGLRPNNGRLWKIFQNIGLEQQFLRSEIRETIISPHLTIPIPAAPEALWQTLFAYFPREKDNLLHFAKLVNGQTDRPLKSGTTSFAEIIKRYHFSVELYFMLEALLGNLGLPADKVDGPSGLAFFREYILDGGYYPVGGMRSLALALREAIRRHGGEVILGQEVVSYHGDKKYLHSLRLKNGEEYQARSFVAAMDARQTLLQMVSSISDNENKKLKDLKPSPSAFMVFLGIDCPLDKLTKHKGHLLHLPEGRMKKIYQSLADNEMLFSSAGYVYIIVPSRIDPAMAPAGSESLCLFIMAPYRNENFWEENRQRMIETIVARAEKVLPGLSEHIQVVDSATPMTLERYTGGYQGATYGWQAVAEQSGIARLSPVTPWDNLFLAGHWTRPGSGLSAAANSGYLAARMVGRHLKN
ncbi:MAG: NAD(P)/FAD-dependent oxidoreductase [Thermodesulfobacteriota bacterium]